MSVKMCDRHRSLITPSWPNKETGEEGRVVDKSSGTAEEEWSSQHGLAQCHMFGVLTKGGILPAEKNAPFRNLGGGA